MKFLLIRLVTTIIQNSKPLYTRFILSVFSLEMEIAAPQCSRLLNKESPRALEVFADYRESRLQPSDYIYLHLKRKRSELPLQH